jgi:hypothetical protein
MNIQSVSCRTCNSKNQTNYQNSQNFKATIVSELRNNISDANMDKYGQWLQNLLLANLPVSKPLQFVHYEDNKVLIPVDDALFNQAETFVNRIKRYFKDHGIRFDQVKIELDKRYIDDIVDPMPF